MALWRGFRDFPAPSRSVKMEGTGVLSLRYYTAPDWGGKRGGISRRALGADCRVFSAVCLPARRGDRLHRPGQPARTGPAFIDSGNHRPGDSPAEYGPPQ
ncbi:protein of unknown function [Kyrpidia spormannii]|uniref:Uncharacterized protein n=1 Tax=Kyrpidia spormannii TaxID=2055160 RepID=A0A6F9E4S2_9BACL|nr:protein of unknown function [Kyrpidia spormannii]